MIRSTRTTGLDSGLLSAALALLAIGLLAIFSASHVTDGAGKVLRQSIWGLLGLLMMWGVVRADYRVWARYWRLLLLGTVVVLLITPFIAPTVNGARSWIDLGVMRLQPSEFAKVAMILVLAALLARVGPRIGDHLVFLRTLLVLALPVLLILAQPDFGTAVVLSCIWLVMVMVAGARWWMTTAVCVGAVLLFLLAWCVPLPNGHTLIKPYQKQRLDFIHADPAGNGYNQRQARIAIGAGGMWGRGFLRGTQARRGFLPEQDTDFIFAVIGEEFGLLGCLVVLGLYVYILFRLLRLCEEAETPFARLVVAGITAMLAVHVFINVGMCLSLSPVTGIPLPLVSYGGSSLLTTLLSLGIVLNISRHRQDTRAWAVSEELIRL